MISTIGVAPAPHPPNSTGTPSARRRVRPRASSSATGLLALGVALDRAGRDLRGEGAGRL
ncbi:MAG TPA: hypothetical protein VH268_03775 [Solirubrobacterales bacterium]|nr:hypothetical protein [Solirubrobacterales bacterium]